MDYSDESTSRVRFGIEKEVFARAISNPLDFVGNAPQQITQFASEVQQWVRRYPDAANYQPEEIL